MRMVSFWLCCFSIFLEIIKIYIKKSNTKKLVSLLQEGCMFTALGLAIAEML